MNVIEFDKFKIKNELDDVDELLEALKGKLRDVVILGYTEDDYLMYDSTMKKSEVTHILSLVKHDIIQSQYEEF